jgi:hypothetical protein
MVEMHLPRPIQSQLLMLITQPPLRVEMVEMVEMAATELTEVIRVLTQMVATVGWVAGEVALLRMPQRPRLLQIV